MNAKLWAATILLSTVAVGSSTTAMDPQPAEAAERLDSLQTASEASSTAPADLALDSVFASAHRTIAAKGFGDATPETQKLEISAPCWSCGWLVSCSFETECKCGVQESCKVYCYPPSNRNKPECADVKRD